MTKIDKLISASCATVRPASAGHQTGVSLVELMVGMAIGLIITAAIITIYINNSAAIRTQEASARVQETGRFILDVVGRSLRQAGNIHITSIQNKNYCNCIPVQGVNGAAGAPDTLTVRYEAGEDENVGGVWGARDCVGGFAPAGTLITNVFSRDVPTNQLRCAGSAGGTQSLAADVEDFQLTYGVDINGDRAVDRRVEDPTAFLPVPHGIVLPPNPANGIVTVHVCVLVRSPDAGAVAAGGRYRECTGAMVANDTRLRRAFNVTYTLRNTVTDIP